MPTNKKATFGIPTHPDLPQGWIIVGAYSTSSSYFTYLSVPPEEKKMLPKVHVSDTIVLSNFYTLTVKKEAAEKAGLKKLDLWPNSRSFNDAVTLAEKALHLKKKPYPAY